MGKIGFICLLAIALIFLLNVSSVSAADVTIEQITNASGNINYYIEKNHTLPSNTNIGGNQVNMSQYLELSTTTILNINSTTNETIPISNYNAAPSPSENVTTRNINKTEYLDIANRIKLYMNNNGRAPNYATQTSTGNTIRYESLVYMFSQILNSYKINGVLPDYITVNPWTTVSNSSSIFFTMDQINTSAGNVKAFKEVNNRLPNYVNISGTQVSMPSFLKLSSMTILNINANLYTSILLKSDGNATNPSETIRTGNISKTEYLDIASRVKLFMDSNGNAPNYASTTLGNIRFESLVFMFSQILHSYSTNNNTLPDNITVIPWINSRSVIGSTSYGYVEKEFYGNQSSNQTIVLIIGVHPQENGIHAAIANAMTAKSANLTKRYVVYNVHVTQDANDYSKGRMNGQLLAQAFVVPDVSNENPMLVLDNHENHGADSGYDYYRFLYLISNTNLTTTYADEIISQMPFLVKYSPPNPTSTQYVTVPIANQGITTIIYETYMYDSETKKASDANTFINALDILGNAKNSTNQTITANPTGGLFNTFKNVTLANIDPNSNATIYYTLDSSDPQTSSTKIEYITPIEINTTTTIRFSAIDSEGNWSSIYNEIYIIDINAPIVTAGPAGGNYYAPQNVVLKAIDDQDGNPTIYYTTDGSNPKTSSTCKQYTSPINISSTKTLKFYAFDGTGCESSVYTVQYRIYKSVRYSYTVNVPYKKVRYKHWYKVKVKKWYKSRYKIRYKYRGKWRTKWKAKWKYRWAYKSKYKWKYKWIYKKETRWGTKNILT